MLVLVLNSGSSSIKYQVREVPDGAAAGDTTPDDVVVTDGIIERIGESEVADHKQALDVLAERLREELGEREIDAVGHRVVHGGERFAEPVLITPEILREIDRLSPLAPLHNPANALGIRAIRDRWPDVPQVAVFDTAFHRTLPEYAWRYAVPNSLYTDHGIRRYGFHGTSHDLVTGVAAQFLDIPRDEFDAIIAHLGNGASVTAVRGGRSVDTSMGFTPLEGLVMGTRSGDIDPSVLTTLIQRGVYSPEEMDQVLNRESGLKGLTGHADMRAVDQAANDGDHRAEVALQTAAYRLAKYIGAFNISVGGAQAIVFTAGIGENSSSFRARVVDWLRPLGVELDPAANDVRSSDPRIISTAESLIPALIVPTDEEQAIATATAQLVAS